MTDQRILAIGAHPDDVEIYCLGLLLTLRIRGWTIGWAVATDGQAGLPEGAPADLRRSEAIAAGGTVGVSPMLLGLTDGGLTGGPEEFVVIRDAIRTFAPSVLVTHPPDDYHPDHRMISRMVSDACPPETALLFTDTMLGAGSWPDLHVDVTTVHADKRRALAAHHSQNAPAFIPALETWSSFRALHTGVRGARHGEGYTMRESIASAAALRAVLGALLASLEIAQV
jgi:LmbE family N-acetylglucosaminyl deacetylase